jgi:rhodanese-related sulfurtransferase
MLDVRTPGEFSDGHVAGAHNMPLDELDADAVRRLRGAEDGSLYLLCQFGGRATRALQRLQEAGVPGCVLVEGGMQAWLDAGFPVERGSLRVIPLIRQVQLTIGAVSGTGALLALTVDPWFAVLPLLTSVGLIIAGVTGTCGLALILAKMPWNRSDTPTPSAGDGGPGDARQQPAACGMASNSNTNRAA